jgi:hypothetical protein
VSLSASFDLNRLVPRRHGAALVFAVLLVLPLAPSAHEIPSDVTVQAFVKPEGQRLLFLVRVPLLAMRDIDFPQLGPGYLNIAEADRSLRDAATLWISDYVNVFENDSILPKPRILATRASLPSDRSFATYQDALAHVRGAPLPNDVELYWEQGLLDVLFEYPIVSDASDFSIEPNFAWLGLRVINVLRFLPPGGAVRAFEFPGDPGLVRLDPRWHQAALQFVELGFFHILDGIDHLLFLLCLVIPFRRFVPLVRVVTAFTLAHSITLIGSAFNLTPSALWFPSLVESLIAMSIVYMAIENMVGGNLHRRWAITFGFGLVHGFGFSFALGQTLQFAGSHLLTSLLSFNIGVELGQLLVLALVVPFLDVLFRYGPSERLGTLILSGLVAHTAWHWTTERLGVLGQYQVQWPVFDLALLASLMRVLMLALIVAGAAWVVFGVLWQDRDRRGTGMSSADEPSGVARG